MVNSTQGIELAGSNIRPLVLSETIPEIPCDAENDCEIASCWDEVEQVVYESRSLANYHEGVCQDYLEDGADLMDEIAVILEDYPDYSSYCARTAYSNFGYFGSSYPNAGYGKVILTDLENIQRALEDLYSSKAEVLTYKVELEDLIDQLEANEMICSPQSDAEYYYGMMQGYAEGCTEYADDAIEFVDEINDLGLEYAEGACDDDYGFESSEYESDYDRVRVLVNPNLTEIFENGTEGYLDKLGKKYLRNVNKTRALKRIRGLRNDSLVAVGLSAENQKLVYKVRHIRRVKLLGFVSIGVLMETRVSAETGRVLNQSTPLCPKKGQCFFNPSKSKKS